MSPFLLKRVENPTEAQVDVCSTLFHDLMRNNQATISFVGGDTALLKLQAAATIRAGALAGEFYVAENGAGDIVGYALWMPPGQEIFNSPEQRAQGLNDFMERLSDAGKEYFRTTYLAEFPAFVNSILGPTGKIDSWWLNMAMVNPEYQRQGVAKSLINIVREKALNAGAAIAFSTTDNGNVPIYVKMGFLHLGNRIMPSPWGEWTVHIFGLNTSFAERK